MSVVATAGHVDHGKSTLVRALTGTDPDRWAEEQRRGLTLDLGYATCVLPSGRRLSLVDVPGHERYVSNALCGLAPARAVLLVVAADRGWQPQTQEHVDALLALGVGHVVLAVTRSDLADPAPVLADARDRLAAVPHVEPVTTPGTPALAAALDRCLDRVRPPAADADVRLWLDRSFDVRGRGRVVTGTLEAGTLQVGDQLVTSAGEDVRVRGLQVHGSDVGCATGPARVALAVRTAARLGRGDALRRPGTHALTDVVDVALSVPLPARPGQLVVHLGTAALPAAVRPLGPGHARLSLPAPVPLRVGDRVVLRDPGRHRVLGGGTVVDVGPLPLTRRGAAAARAAELAVADPLALALARGPQHVDALRRAGLGFERSPQRPVSTGTADAPRLVGDWLTTGHQLQALGAQLAQEVTALAPTTAGLTVAAAAVRLGIPEPLVTAVAAQAGLTVRAGTVVNPQHSLGPADVAVRALEQRLRSDPLGAPDRGELRAQGLDARALATAHSQGLLLRIAPDVVVHPTAPARAERVLSGVPQPFTPGEAARALGASRRVVVPLLEHLDATGLTTRDGPVRRLRVSPPAPGTAARR